MFSSILLRIFFIHLLRVQQSLTFTFNLYSHYIRVLYRSVNDSEERKIFKDGLISLLCLFELSKKKGGVVEN